MFHFSRTSTNSQFQCFFLLNIDFLNIFLILISISWVLTAAHCVTQGASLNVYLGIFADGKFAEIYVVEPENQYIHPNFISVDKGHDICMCSIGKYPA